MPKHIKVGAAYRSSYDGIVRWVTRTSSDGTYRLKWLDEENNVWHAGGTMHKGDVWEGFAGEEVPAPQPGDTIREADWFGVVDTYTL